MTHGLHVSGRLHLAGMIAIRERSFRERLLEDLLALSGAARGVEFQAREPKVPVSGVSLPGGYALVGGCLDLDRFFVTLQTEGEFDPTEMVKHIGYALDVEAWEVIMAWPQPIRIEDL